MAVARVRLVELPDGAAAAAGLLAVTGGCTGVLGSVWAMCGGCAALGARQRWQLAVRMALLVVSDGGSRFCTLPRRDLRPEGANDSEEKWPR